MKHPISARDVAAGLLREEERGRTFLKDLMPNARAGIEDPRDRALVTELAYGTVRRRSTLDSLLSPLSRRPLPKLSGAVRSALRMGLYQILFLDRVPVHAAVDHAVSWTRRHGGDKAGGYVNAVLRNAARQIEGQARGGESPRRDVPREDGSAIRWKRNVFGDPGKDLVANLAARYACPAWLVERWISHHGEARARTILRVGIGRPPLTLRSRTDRNDLYRALGDKGVTARAGAVDSALLVEHGSESAALEFVTAGRAWVQDVTAQRVAPLLRPEPGHRLLDLCAAPGGKTLHLTDLLDDLGEVVACDVDPFKLARIESLRDHVRPGVRVLPVEIPRDGVLPFEDASFDGVLVDAPCSNTGVLRRRVEARWRLRESDVVTLAGIQRDLLERARPLLKPGGRLVYATCSLEPEENERLARAFDAAHPDLLREPGFEVLPGSDHDGGFVAVFVRGG